MMIMVMTMMMILTMTNSRVMMMMYTVLCMISNVIKLISYILIGHINIPS